jgi:hypothetical protein
MVLVLTERTPVARAIVLEIEHENLDRQRDLAGGGHSTKMAEFGAALAEDDGAGRQSGAR